MTDFDRVRIEGPLAVTIATGGAPGARAEGSSEALDALVLRVDGRTLVVRMSASARGQYPDQRIAAPAVRLSVPALRSATVLGAGRLDVDRMKGLRVDLTVTGSGRIAVAAIEADRLAGTIVGNGGLMLAGRAQQASFVNRGAGSIDAGAVAVKDLTVTSESAGDASFAAERTARVTATGAGSIAVEGNADCVVRATGAGEVRCGREGEGG